MSISDGQWTNSTDPFRSPTPTFTTTPSKTVSGSNLIYVRWTGRNFISNVVDDDTRQRVVLEADSDQTIEHMDEFYSLGDRVTAGANEWSTYTEKYTGSSGSRVTLTMFGPTFLINNSLGDTTWHLDGTVVSFPSSDFRVVASTMPSYCDVDCYELIFSLGVHYATAAVWDDDGLGGFESLRTFMDKTSFQAAADTIWSPRFRFICLKFKSIEELIVRVMKQTGNFYAIRPTDDTGGQVSMHAWEREGGAWRSDLVLSSRTLAMNEHVKTWELRKGAVEPVTGIRAQYGAYAVRKHNDNPTPSVLRKNDFPLDYETGEDRITNAFSSDNIVDIDYPDIVSQSNAIFLYDRGGIMVMQQGYFHHLPQDELEVEFDQYGWNFLPGDLVKVFIEDEYDETNGDNFIVERTDIKGLLTGEIAVTFRRVYGVDPVPMTKIPLASGSLPYNDWAFIYSADNLRSYNDDDDPFDRHSDTTGRKWLNLVAPMEDKFGYALGDADWHITGIDLTGSALYRNALHDQAPYGYPSVEFVTGAEQRAADIASGDALFWFVWWPDGCSSGEYIYYHEKDTNNYLSLVCLNSTQFLFQVRLAGTTTNDFISFTDDSPGYFVAQFGGNNTLNISGSTSTSSTTAHPGTGTTNPHYFGTSGGGATPAKANFSELGLIFANGSEDIDDMYDQLLAYLGEKYGIV